MRPMHNPEANAAPCKRYWRIGRRPDSQRKQTPPATPPNEHPHNKTHSLYEHLRPASARYIDNGVLHHGRSWGSKARHPNGDRHTWPRAPKSPHPPPETTKHEQASMCLGECAIDMPRRQEATPPMNAVDKFTECACARPKRLRPNPEASRSTRAPRLQQLTAGPCAPSGARGPREPRIKNHPRHRETAMIQGKWLWPVCPRI